MFIRKKNLVRSVSVLFLFVGLNVKADTSKWGQSTDEVRKNLCSNYIEIPENAIRNSYSELRDNEATLMVFRQLWNLYYLRNEAKMNNPQERREVESLINSTRPPCLHSDMPGEVVRKQVLNSATSLLVRLSKEIRTAPNDESRARAQANFDFLAKNFMARLKSGGYVSKIAPHEMKRLSTLPIYEVAQ